MLLGDCRFMKMEKQHKKKCKYIGERQKKISLFYPMLSSKVWAVWVILLLIIHYIHVKA